MAVWPAGPGRVAGRLAVLQTNAYSLGVSQVNHSRQAAEAELAELRLTVNGAEVTVACPPGVPLLDVLRHDLGLAGPRFGCGLGLCGACFVLVDGEARPSCDLPAWAAEGRQVTTVEGLCSGGGPGRLQRAFLEEQAAQCGYCTAGMIISAAALLRATPHPGPEQVRAALERNLCRCGSHGRVIRAVLAAAATEAVAGEPLAADGTAAPAAGEPAEPAP
jgi:nicotinate dehydrogenase subunit A